MFQSATPLNAYRCPSPEVIDLGRRYNALIAGCPWDTVEEIAEYLGVGTEEAIGAGLDVILWETGAYRLVRTQAQVERDRAASTRHLVAA